MPVTAKFSEKFYQTLGHGLVDELVDWCNQVDATYRSEFRELFDTRFAVFDAKFAAFDAKLEQRLAEAKAELKTEFRTELARLETRLTLRMFLFWVGSVGLFLVQRV